MVNFVTESLPLVLFSLFIFGLVVGSFLNVVIYRLPLIMEHSWKQQAREILKIKTEPEDEEPFTIAYPPSHCPSCKEPIRFWSNIPLISFLVQRGRCVHCGHSISWQYPIVEASTAVAFIAVYCTFGWSVQTVAGLLFSCLVIAMFAIDAQKQLLPDSLTLLLLWLGLLFNTQNIFAPLSDAVWGAVAGYMSLWLLFYIFKFITGKEGMGFGDFKLFAALGAWFGVSALPVIILLSALVGIFFALVVFRIGQNKAMPFGPYLAASGWIVLIWQEPVMQLVQWWLTRSGLAA